MTGDRQLTIRGAASLQLLLRVVNLIEQRGALPHRIEAVWRDDEMVVQLDLADLPRSGREIFAEKLRSLVEVAWVSDADGAPRSAAQPRT